MGICEEIQDSHIPRKRGILVLTSVNLAKKRLFFIPVFYSEKVGSFGRTSLCFTTKRGFILDWKVSALSQKRGCFELKSQCFAEKGGHFQTGEQGWVPFFPVREVASSIPLRICFTSLFPTRICILFMSHAFEKLCSC